MHGKTDHGGRVEIFLNDRWGSICYHGFDKVDADVACRDLGFSRSTKLDLPSWQGSEPVMEDLRCTGTEARFADCPRNNEPRMCFIQIVAGITCNGHRAKARGLLAHEDTNYREWGASGSVRIDPGAAGRGLSLTLTPAWGADSGGAERLWSARDARGLAANDAFEPPGSSSMWPGGCMGNGRFATRRHDRGASV